MELARGLGIEREIELIFPAKFEPRLGNRVVAALRAGMTFSEIGGVRGDLVGDDASLTSFLFGKPRCSFGVT
jgi:hypothetical protein